MRGRGTTMVRWARRGLVPALVVTFGAVGLAACTLLTATTTSLSAGAAQVVSGQPVALTANVVQSPTPLSTPSGSVRFYEGVTTIGSAPLVSGTATLNVSTLAVGVHHLSAAFVPSGAWGSSYSTPVTVTVVASTNKYYVSMGDSLSTGVGAGPGQGYVDDIFAHEATRLPGLIAQPLGCSGATTASMINGGGCTYPQGSQLAAAEAFLTAHPGQVAFLTIDIGANDITGCFSGAGVNLTCAQNAITTVSANLNTILTRLRAAGGAVPIFAMNYYDPFLAFWVAGNQTAATQSEQAAVSGNGVMEGVYQSFNAQVADVETTFDTTNFALTGTYNATTVPQNVANICAWTLMCPAGNIHANVTGHQLIANTFQPLIDATVHP